MTNMPRMAPLDLAITLHCLGLTHREASALLATDERQIRRWVAGKARIPAAATYLLRLMVRLELSPADVLDLTKRTGTAA